MAKRTESTKPRRKAAGKRLDVRRDSMDFRDLTYSASLAPLPDELYPDWPLLHILDQGEEGACTGFGLAAAINYLRGRRALPGRASPQMLFAMARRYDQWPGENYDFSSARGAMKGWHKHGVCLEGSWRGGSGLTPAIQQEALDIPLGAYFRVFSRINDVQAALRDVGVLFASARTHEGWRAPRRGVIDWKPDSPDIGGGHAFALIGYNRDGFLVQNSWGPDWGGYRQGKASYAGVALWSYADFEANVWDVWVAQLGVAVNHGVTDTATRYVSDGGTARLALQGPPQEAIYLHYLHIDDGRFDGLGQYASDLVQVEAIIEELQHSKPQHLLLYAHGGLNSVNGSAMRAFKWRPAFRDNGVHELHFIWETGLLAELGDILLGKLPLVGERVGSVSSWWDNQVESLVQPAGFALWQEMKRDADRAFQKGAAGTQALQRLVGWLAAQGTQAPKVHLVGHSAGSIWHARLWQAWQALNGPAIDNLVLFAPACTLELYQTTFLKALGHGIRQQTLFVLSDQAEQEDNVAKVYRKSLLYLVSNALDDRQRRVPLLGMQKFQPAQQPPGSTLVVASTSGPASRSTSHGGFDNDLQTMDHLLRVVLGSGGFRGFKVDELKGY
ncbi:C1 family peptidase [Metapseudomonas resinovorans]|uniref:C1 family peptidase n=1 Tax=Metapseudomonas resinovorans TaxID=53412 RepID=UPI000409D53A|nr:C1 family peptidase [Pseudomonas resinovorans]MDE3739538.1 C1 family peptidase [Pseudomonas resinovorans]